MSKPTITHTYKGYTGSADWDEDNGIYGGRVLGLGRDIVTFVGVTGDEVRRSMEESIDLYLAGFAGDTRKPDRPYSGLLIVCVSPKTHRALERLAAAGDESVARLAGRLLDESMGGMGGGTVADDENAP